MALPPPASAGAATSVANPLAGASSSGAVRRTTASPTVVGVASGAVRRDAAPPSVAGGAVGAERPVLTLPSALDAPSAAPPSRDRARSLSPTALAGVPSSAMADWLTGKRGPAAFSNLLAA